MDEITILSLTKKYGYHTNSPNGNLASLHRAIIQPKKINTKKTLQLFDTYLTTTFRKHPRNPYILNLVNQKPLETKIVNLEKS